MLLIVGLLPMVTSTLYLLIDESKTMSWTIEKMEKRQRSRNHRSPSAVLYALFLVAQQRPEIQLSQIYLSMPRFSIRSANHWRSIYETPSASMRLCSSTSSTSKYWQKRNRLNWNWQWNSSWSSSFVDKKVSVTSLSRMEKQMLNHEKVSLTQKDDELISFVFDLNRYSCSKKNSRRWNQLFLSSLHGG